MTKIEQLATETKLSIEKLIARRIEQGGKLWHQIKSKLENKMKPEPENKMKNLIKIDEYNSIRADTITALRVLGSAHDFKDRLIVEYNNSLTRADSITVYTETLDKAIKLKNEIEHQINAMVNNKA